MGVAEKVFQVTRSKVKVAVHGNLVNSIAPELLNGFEPKLIQTLTDVLGTWETK